MKEKALAQQQENLTTRLTEAELVKGQLEDSKKTLSVREKQLAEKEKARQRRSLNFHEEEKTRIQLEQEVDELQISFSELQEKYESIVASLEARLSVEKERVGMLSASQDTTAKEFAREREITTTQAENIRFVKAENLCLSKSNEELQSQLRTSHQALQILEQRFQISTTKTERELEIVSFLFPLSPSFLSLWGDWVLNLSFFFFFFFMHVYENSQRSSLRFSRQPSTRERSSCLKPPRPPPRRRKSGRMQRSNSHRSRR